MTPCKPDPVTSIYRGLFFTQTVEEKFQSVDQYKRLFSASRLVFTWRGIIEKADPLAYSAARSDIKQIAEPFVLATWGKKSAKWIRYTGKILAGNKDIYTLTTWTSAGVAMIGRGVQSLSLICRFVARCGLGIVADVFASIAAGVTSFFDCVALGIRIVRTKAQMKKNYLFCKLAREILSLACTILTTVALLHAYVNPLSPWIFAALSTAAFTLSFVKYFFKETDCDCP